MNGLKHWKINPRAPSESDLHRGAKPSALTSYETYKSHSSMYDRFCDWMEDPFVKKMTFLTLSAGVALNVWVYSNIYETEKFLRDRKAPEQKLSVPSELQSQPLPLTPSRLLYIIQDDDKFPFNNKA
ncbi:MAG: hypothetical protein Q8Q31_04560 [Nanoarchaeota archaeon]|nr:hypothetical protein [Nanoarchaeota archaeon]